MFTRFYGLNANPFTLSPDPAYVFLTEKHQHALALLEYALHQGSAFALISGEIGSGKTTMIQYLLGRVPQGLRLAVLANTHPDMGALLPWIVHAFGIDATGASAPEMHGLLADFLQGERQHGRRAVLIVDEAQNLTARGLEELRVLSNLNVGPDQLLQTILVGQPELRATLSAPDMRQFAQRIAIDYHLEALGREETHAYVEHRLRIAGGGRALITPGAQDLLWQATGGIPRLINQICETAFVYGFAEQRMPIDAEIVCLALEERRRGGILPLERPRAASGLADATAIALD